MNALGSQSGDNVSFGHAPKIGDASLVPRKSFRRLRHNTGQVWRRLRRSVIAEFFQRDKNHQRQDADLHEQILEDGDDDAAQAVGVAVMRRHGLSDQQIAALTRGKK